MAEAAGALSVRWRLSESVAELAGSDLAQRQLFDADAALRIADQSGDGDWIDAALVRFRLALVRYSWPDHWGPDADS